MPKGLHNPVDKKTHKYIKRHCHDCQHRKSQEKHLKKALESIPGLGRSQESRSTHKNQFHFYSLIMTTQKTKFKNTISFKISSKMKCLGINLTKQI